MTELLSFMRSASRLRKPGFRRLCLAAGFLLLAATGAGVRASSDSDELRFDFSLEKVTFAAELLSISDLSRRIFGSGIDADGNYAMQLVLTVREGHGLRGGDARIIVSYRILSHANPGPDNRDDLVRLGNPLLLGPTVEGSLSQRTGEVNEVVVDGSEVRLVKVNGNPDNVQIMVTSKSVEANSPQHDESSLVIGRARGLRAQYTLIFGTEAAHASTPNTLEAGDKILIGIPGVWNLGALDVDSEVFLQVDVLRLAGAVYNGPESPTTIPSPQETQAPHLPLFDFAEAVQPIAMDAPELAPDIDFNDHGRLLSGGVDFAEYAAPIQALEVGRVHLQTNTQADIKDINGLDSFGTISIEYPEPNPNLLLGDRVVVLLNGVTSGEHRAYLDLNGDNRLDNFSEWMNIPGTSPADSSGSLPADSDRRYLPTSRPWQQLTEAPRSIYVARQPGSDWNETESFSVAIRLEYDASRNLDARMAGFTASVTPAITMPGTTQVAHVHDVPNCYADSRVHIHVTNNTLDPVNLFVRGVDNLRNILSLSRVDISMARGSGGARLAPRETLVLRTEHLERALGFVGGSPEVVPCSGDVDTWGGLGTEVDPLTFTGRRALLASLTFFSDGEVTINPVAVTRSGVILPWLEPELR